LHRWCAGGTQAGAAKKAGAAARWRWALPLPRPRPPTTGGARPDGAVPDIGRAPSASCARGIPARGLDRRPDHPYTALARRRAPSCKRVAATAVGPRRGSGRARALLDLMSGRGRLLQGPRKRSSSRGALRGHREAPLRGARSPPPIQGHRDRRLSRSRRRARCSTRCVAAVPLRAGPPPSRPREGTSSFTREGRGARWARPAEAHRAECTALAQKASSKVARSGARQSTGFEVGGHRHRRGRRPPGLRRGGPRSDVAL